MTAQATSSQPDSAVLTVTDLCKAYGGQPVLSGISFRLAQGQGLCIFGPNASGKTTLIRTLAGLLTPDHGRLAVCGHDLAAEPLQAKAKLGVLLHLPLVYPHLTVLENLRFFAGLFGLSDPEARIDQLLELTDLSPYCHEPTAILSRGMVQRLAVARALLHRPQLLLADEPFTALDAHACQTLVQLFRDFQAGGGTLVMTSHNVRLALQCCSHLAVLDQNRFILQAEAATIDIEAFAQDYLSYARARL